ncbi:hypothetical protein BBW65_05275 [Helicobacter enhydrae]|uniref:Uncharacterized protein n=1 Tax=Helicobacter enhydrae TaxID=222136 RepID=A0A1B1U6B4_9HELI|nr:hypothetical protein BBW65_05275 [Helicobacter enhydrae]
MCFFQSKHQKDRIRKIQELPKSISPLNSPKKTIKPILKQDSNQIRKLKSKRLPNQAPKENQSIEQQDNLGIQNLSHRLQKLEMIVRHTHCLVS